MDGLLILFVVVLLSLLVTRVAAVALTLTGMSPQVAHFQARSALSSTGLGTREAEQVMGHPARRQIYLTLMLIGNAGLVTGIASLSRALGSIDTFGNTVVALAAVIVGLLVLLMLARSQRFSRAIAKIAELVLRRYTDLDVGDYHGLLHLGMHYGVDRIKVDEGHWMSGQTLADSRLTDEGMLVLGVERPNGVYLGAPRGDTSVEPGNRLLVYGPTGPLAELHQRPAGPEGDRLHELMVEASQTREAEERSRDRKRRGWRPRRRRSRPVQDA
ncbi:TrkA C-terminal domain-containing protein [Euzebya tangerina]|uniref:TrkA C-terminal domain-containing protein n=1 Tax=Euzebya tangerina TaxID=591198 RepID=UPI000E31EFA4|nr:TrkA C-terminal domain-containing protein [Euzebya tangerina]